MSTHEIDPEWTWNELEDFARAQLAEVARLCAALEAIRLLALHEGRPETDDFAHHVYEASSEALGSSRAPEDKQSRP